MIIRVSLYKAYWVFKMIEAVKSTLAATPLIQKSLEQASNARSFAVNPERTQEVAEIPYVSPSVRVDNNAKVAILEFRDSLSGDVLVQIPSEAQLEAYKRRQAKEDASIEADISGANKKVQEAEDRGDIAAAAIAKAETQPSEAALFNELQIDV